MKFADLRLDESLVRAVTAEGYEVATPIQAKAIPHVLEGKDVLGIAQTGTGKTAAFALPILNRLMTSKTRQVKARCLVLSPTRELATQIADSFRAYGKHTQVRSTVIFGGVNQNPQAQALRRGVDVIVATPGRLVDLIEQRLCDLSGIEVLVLDEADRMLDMGFIHDIRKVVAKVPQNRQTLFFSATMPVEIKRLAGSILRNPVTVQVTPVASTAERVEQVVYHVEKRNKPALLAHLVDSLPMARAIVFARTKHGADKVVRHLHVRGIRSEAIHGNKSQNARQRALDNFKAGRIPVLVATDIASRGIDVDGITHVVNYDITHEPETYVHRIGRTARAGASGMAVSLCDQEERENLRQIERLIKQTITVRTDHPTYPAASEQQQHERRQQPAHAQHQHQHRPERREQHDGQPQQHQQRAHPLAAAARKPHQHGGPRHTGGGVKAAGAMRSQSHPQSHSRSPVAAGRPRRFGGGGGRPHQPGRRRAF